MPQVRLNRASHSYSTRGNYFTKKPGIRAPGQKWFGQNDAINYRKKKDKKKKRGYL